MMLPEMIQTGIDYIEQNLKTYITAEELAQMSNYSTFHYCRLFSFVMGSSVAEYILKRRLDHALAEIAEGRKAVEVVLEYGFNTYAGFYKAFIKMYGCSPKKYVSIYHKHQPVKPEVTNMYTEKELRLVLDNWDIEKKLPIYDVYVMNGAKTSNTVWKVGNDYILKTGDRERVLKNLKVAKALHSQGFSSAIPVPTKSGTDYLDGKDVFILSHSIRGNILHTSDRFGEDRLQFAYKYGQSIAGLHKALKAVQKEVVGDEFNLFKVVKEWALPNVRQQNKQWGLEIDGSFFDDYIENFGKLYNDLPKQLIHRDPNPGNILFLNGNVTGFIDFDLSEVNIRLWDPCYCATGILSEADVDIELYERWLEVLSGILQGYDSINNLTPEEKRAVYYTLSSIQFIFLAYFESKSADKDFKQLANINRKMLKYIIQNKESILNIFAE